jgi:hypothetical protein
MSLEMHCRRLKKKLISTIIPQYMYDNLHVATAVQEWTSTYE